MHIVYLIKFPRDLAALYELTNAMLKGNIHPDAVYVW